METNDKQEDKENQEKETKKGFHPIKWIKSRIISIKKEKYLGRIMVIHLVLILLHIMTTMQYDIHYHADLRVAGCALIILISALFGRKGYALAILTYSCSLVYVNNFYNYGSAFFLIIAYSAFPKIKPQAIILFMVNMLCSFNMQRLPATSAGFQICYWLMYEYLKDWLFTVKPAVTLKLTDDECKILDELVDGKMQKEIDLWSEQTVSAKIKAARERNLCETTSELITMYINELGIKIGICGKPCKKNCPQRKDCPGLK